MCSFDSNILLIFQKEQTPPTTPTSDSGLTVNEETPAAIYESAIGSKVGKVVKSGFLVKKGE